VFEQTFKNIDDVLWKEAFQNDLRTINALPTITRQERAFLDFVLARYVDVGVEELDQEKLTPLLRLKYHNSIADAVEDLGRPVDGVSPHA
jgi:hypothetical protein